MHRKNIKDQATSIYSFHLKDLFQPALLGWRELVICDQKCEPSLHLCSKKVSSLSCTNVCVRVCVTTLLPLCTNNLSTRGAREAGQFFKAINRWPTRIFSGICRDKKSALY